MCLLFASCQNLAATQKKPTGNEVSSQVSNFDYVNRTAESSKLIETQTATKVSVLFEGKDFNIVSNFSQGMAVIKNQEELYQYINLEGETAFDAAFSYAAGFTGNYAVIGRTPADNENEILYGVIDRSGKEVLPAEFAEMPVCANDIFYVGQDGMWTGYSAGKEVVFGPTLMFPPYKFSHGYMINTVAETVNDPSPLMAFYRPDGKQAFGMTFQNAFDFSDGLARVCIDEKYGYIDQNGETVIPCQYELAYDFINGFALVKTSGKFSFIDKTGTIIAKDITEKAFSGCNFSNGLAAVVQKDKLGYIDEQGKFVLRPKYTFSNYPAEFTAFSNGVCVFYQKGLAGLINIKGAEILKASYKSISPLSEDGTCMAVTADGKTVFLKVS